MFSLQLVPPSFPIFCYFFVACCLFLRTSCIPFFLLFVYSSIVWSSSTLESRRLIALTNQEFLAELNTAMQSPSLVDRWSPLNLNNASAKAADSTFQDGFPSFSPMLRSILQPLQNVAVMTILKPLQKAKVEVAALADIAMNASLLQVRR